MPMTRSKLLRKFALGTGIAFGAAACGVGSSLPAPSLTSSTPTDSTQLFKVATAPPFPPLEMKGEKDDLVGFDIDLINAIAQQAGVKIELQAMPFGDIIPALKAGRVDAAISGIPITQERAREITFSRPYLEASLVIAIREETKGIVSEADLQGKVLAVQLGTSGADRAVDIMGSKITVVSSADEALTALNSGKVDAVLHHKPALLGAIAAKKIKGIRLIEPPLAENFYGIALPSNSPYTKTLNQALTDLIANGTYAKLYQKWFNATPPTLP